MGRRIYFVHAQATVLVVCGKQSCMTVKIQCLADIQVQLWPAVLLLKAKSTNSQYRRIGRRNSLFSQMATSYSLAFSKTARSDSGQLGIELFRPGLREVHFDLGGFENAKKSIQTHTLCRTQLATHMLRDSCGSGVERLDIRN